MDSPDASGPDATAASGPDATAASAPDATAASAPDATRADATRADTTAGHIPGQRPGGGEQPADPAAYQPATGQPTDAGAGAPAGRTKRRRPRPRRLLLTAAILLTGACLVGATIGFLAYDRATKIDRSSPVVVVEQYVDAVFSERDPNRAALFECSDGDPRADLQVLLDDLMERERRWDIQITVTTANYRTSTGRVSSRIDVDLLIDVPEADGRPSRSRQTWEFDLRDESGWRVCAARRAA